MRRSVTTVALDLYRELNGRVRGALYAVRVRPDEAARELWNSYAYPTIRPLREGIVRFELLVLPVSPIPPYYRE